jgi:hypothetical protein
VFWIDNFRRVENLKIGLFSALNTLMLTFALSMAATSMCSRRCSFLSKERPSNDGGAMLDMASLTPSQLVSIH